ncbi:hypothetical protein CRUP_026125 [Coryphaenoides rupestris]|nr:hypothetical protein CRUP_026125 [Coryphaenoides rupestris]
MSLTAFRGKTSGHDADFLITHPIEGEEEGLLRKVIACLESRGLLLYHQTTRNSYQEAPQGPGRPSSSMDHFETCFSIFKLTNHSHPEDTKRQLQMQQQQKDQDPARVQVEGDQDPARVEVEGDQDPARVEVKGDQDPAQVQVASGSRPWRAVRVDLVVSPISQFAFALLGWTGSKLREGIMGSSQLVCD